MRDEYERKLSEMQKEMKRLQSAKKEHARLLRNQTQHENQVKTLKGDLAEMKRAKVSLFSSITEPMLLYIFSVQLPGIISPGSTIILCCII